jgi:hypothetical protein
MSKLDRPIYVPANPFWQVFKTFGRDELIAGILSFIATALLSLSFYLADLNEAAFAALCLAFIGPIVEKFGFFIGHIKDARDIWETTPVDERKEFSFYAKRALRGGGKSLLQDILIHDPLYVGFMLGGMYLHPQTPAWLLVPVAFGVAVFIVAVGEVSFNELRYKLLIRKLLKKGFEKEGYLEAHFLVRSENPDQIIRELQKKFLPDVEIKTFEYYDKYYGSSLPEYNARAPKVRIRKRTLGENSWFHTFQVVYTKTIEEQEEPNQFRFFPIAKEKIYYILDPEKDYCCANSAANVDFASENPIKTLEFLRRVVYDRKKIFIAVDTVDNNESNIHIIEIKAYYGQEKLLKQAMRFAMMKFPILQTTFSKLDLNDYSEFEHLVKHRDCEECVMKKLCLE